MSFQGKRNLLKMVILKVPVMCRVQIKDSGVFFGSTILFP